MTASVLLLAHGSPDLRHARTIAAVTSAVAGAVDVPVAHAFLDHHSPDATTAVRGLVARGATELVTVPLLLSVAYHRETDVPVAVNAGIAAFPGLRSVIGDVLAPDARLAQALQRRLHEAGAAPDGPVVLATAGARAAIAAVQCAAVAAALSELRGGDVVVAAPGQVAGALGSLSRPAAVATYLLAPGVIGDRITDEARSTGAVVAAPIGDAPEVVDVVVDRFLAARNQLARDAA
jgi:sirohydrochlorin ferrochelatase